MLIWQTRTISTFVAYTAMTDGENPLVAAAQSIGEPADKQQSDRPGEPRAGSFEAFMSTFGAPHRWAGA